MGGGGGLRDPPLIHLSSAQLTAQLYDLLYNLKTYCVTVHLRGVGLGWGVGVEGYQWSELMGPITNGRPVGNTLLRNDTWCRAEELGVWTEQRLHPTPETRKPVTEVSPWGPPC